MPAPGATGGTPPVFIEANDFAPLGSNPTPTRAGLPLPTNPHFLAHLGGDISLPTKKRLAIIMPDYAMVRRDYPSSVT